MKSLYGMIHVRPRVTNSTTCRLVSLQRDSGCSSCGNTMAKRTRISDEQRGILERCFAGGMVGTGTMYKEMVLKASTDTGLTKAQVEVSLLIHLVNLGCSFIPGCASFYLNNSTNQTKLAIRIDRRCIYMSIIA